MPRQATKLSEKHWKAIELIGEGKMSLKEIALSLGWEPTTLYRLHEGSEESMGKTAILFQAEVKKLTAKNVSKIKGLICDNKALALMMMNDFYRRKMAQEFLSDDDIMKITVVFNALTKASSGIEINATSSVYKNYTPEEMVLEYNRLRTLAEGASVRGVSGPGRAESADSDL